MTNKELQNITLESLRDWFKKEDWVRISSDGSIAGPCGTSKNKKNPDRCLPRAKAQSLTKAQRAATAAKKKKAGSKGKTVVKNTKAATVKKEGLWANINAKKKAGKKSSHKNSNAYKDAKKAGNALKQETANPQDGKAAPYGSGYKPIKKMKEEKKINKSQIEKLKDMIKSLKKSSKGHAGQADYLKKLVSDNITYHELMTKEKLLGLMKNSDDALVQIYDGSEYLIYSPNSGNQDNADMWDDESVLGITRDGDERDIRYKDIVSVSAYDVDETKGAPSGHYFTKSGNLVKGTLSKDAKERGARLSDPKDKQRSKVPPVTQYNENVTLEDIKNLTVGLLHEVQGKEVLMEKDDRCTRRAKREYDTWPSAYASGAVVRCRRGDIWPKK